MSSILNWYWFADPIIWIPGIFVMIISFVVATMDYRNPEDGEFTLFNAMQLLAGLIVSAVPIVNIICLALLVSVGLYWLIDKRGHVVLFESSTKKQKDVERILKR